MSNTQEEMNQKRNEYMETLALQAQLNDMNLQANKLYLRTGQLPPTSQIPDTRTTSEKLANIEYLKAEIAKSMSKIGSPSFAYAVAEGMMNSPLNVDNKLVEFFAQNVDSIMKELEKKYKYGIKGDKNDVETLVLFVKDLMVNQSEKSESIKSYMNSNRSNFGSSSLVISENDVDIILRQMEELTKKLYLSSGGFGLEEVMSKVRVIKSILPSNEELENLTRSITSLDEEEIQDDGNFGNTDRITGRQAVDYKAFFQMLKDLPKYNDVVYLLNLLEKIGRPTPQNLKQRQDVIKKLNGLFAESIKYIRSNHQSIKHILGELMARDKVVYTQDQLNRRKQIQEDIERGRETHVIIDNPEDNAVWVRHTDDNGSMPSLEPNYQDSDTSDYGYPVADDVLDVNPMNNPFNYLSEPEGRGIRGRRRGRPIGRGIIKEKPPKATKIPSYKPFGINEINHKKLDNGILTVRRKSKTNYMDLPSKAISSNLKGIIKTISGGGTPSYNDMSKLTEEEQDYLHKLVKKSDLQDKLSVPTPSKDKQEKDFHEFEVLKGEIMSGNDSKELVKKFKLLVVKLSRQGVLPKNESNELLLTLTELGY